MIFALVVAGLVAAIAVSLVVLVQASRARTEQKVIERKRNVAELATRSGGVLTPRLVARELGVTPLEAERVLRSMVDDVFLTMEIDRREGELRYTFLELTSGDGRARRMSSIGRART